MAVGWCVGAVPAAAQDRPSLFQMVAIKTCMSKAGLTPPGDRSRKPDPKEKAVMDRCVIAQGLDPDKMRRPD